MNRFKEFYFIGLLAIWVLAGCSGYAAWIMYTADVQEAATLVTHFPQHAQWLGAIQPAFTKLRLLLTSIAIGSSLLSGLLAWRLNRRGYPTCHIWRAGWQQAWHGLAQSWRSLLPRQRHGALAAFVALTLLRISISRVLVTFDDGASYEYFVRKSLLSISAYYPAPNNHILSNTISWLFYQVHPDYWWSMRMPVLLVSAAGTVGWFLGLLRCSNFRVAALTTVLFSLVELSLFYAAEGRGYALLMALSSAGFFCVLALTGPGAEPSAPKLAIAWSGLVAAGVLGLYTIPTFAYFLVAAYSWLGIRWLRKPYHQRLASLCIAGAVTLLGAALLYSPLLLVSGPGSLFQNEFVVPLETSIFFRQFPAYLWETEGCLLGESHNGVLATIHLGSLAAVAVVAGLLALVAAARRGHLPASQATYILRLGLPALWFVVLPYALLLVQRVQAPNRTLWFKAVFMFLLVGLETDWLFRRAENTRLARFSLLLGVGLWVGVQFTQLYRSNELRLSYLHSPHLVAKWLLQQPPGPVLAPGGPWYLSFIRFYLHFEAPTSSLEIDGTPRPNVQYRYLINPPADSLASARVALPQLHVPSDANCEAIDVLARW